MADFIVNDITPRVQYTAGGGSPTVFSYAFPIFEDTDLNVYLTPVGVEADDTTQLLTYNIDYTVTNSTPPTVGGFITLTVGATLGDVITIVRNQPYNRLDNYVQGGLFLATSINTDFDKTVFMSQQDKMYDRVLSPHYNVSGQPAYPKDILLPVLDANETWVMNNAGTQITTYDISGGGGGVVNSATGTANRIDVTPSTGNIVINISASYLGQNSITTLGTITTGTWNGATIGVAYGGTNITSYTLGDTLYASGATTLVKLAGNITTAKQYLSQTGTGVVSAAPIWSTIDGGDITGAALTKVDDTNVTLTLGGTPATALLRATSLTLGWTGQLAVTRGGTGLSSVVQGDLLYGSAANTYSLLNKDTNATRYLSNTGTNNNPAWAQIELTNGVTGVLPLANGGTNANLTASNGGIVWSNATQMQILAGTATARQMLQSGATATPAWSTATWPATTTINRLLYSSANNVVDELATANSATLVTNSTGVPAWTASMTDGQVLIGSTGATPTPATLTAGTNVTITNAAGSITINSTAGGASAATQAEQEAASSTAVYTSPGRQQFHPSASKAWALFNGTGTPALSASYNITSITDNGNGDYTLNFITAFSTANFSVSGTTNTSTSGAAAAVIVPGTWAVGSIRFTVRNSIAGSWSPGDETQISIQCFGDQ